MYQWLLDQQITKLYSLHPMVPKQIKGTPKEYRSISGHWFISGPSIIFALGSHEFQYFFGPQLWNDKKLENEHFKKYPYEQLTCDELEKFIEIIETAKLFGKRIGQYSNIEPPLSYILNKNLQLTQKSPQYLVHGFFGSASGPNRRTSITVRETLLSVFKFKLF